MRSEDAAAPLLNRSHNLQASMHSARQNTVRYAVFNTLVCFGFLRMDMAEELTPSTTALKVFRSQECACEKSRGPRRGIPYGKQYDQSPRRPYKLWKIPASASLPVNMGRETRREWRLSPDENRVSTAAGS